LKPSWFLEVLPETSCSLSPAPTRKRFSQRWGSLPVPPPHSGDFLYPPPFCWGWFALLHCTKYLVTVFLFAPDLTTFVSKTCHTFLLLFHPPSSPCSSSTPTLTPVTTASRFLSQFFLQYFHTTLPLSVPRLPSLQSDALSPLVRCRLFSDTPPHCPPTPFRG